MFPLAEYPSERTFLEKFFVESKKNLPYRCSTVSSVEYRCRYNIYVKGPRAGPGPLGPRAPGILPPLPPPLDGPEPRTVSRTSLGLAGGSPDDELSFTESSTSISLPTRMCD
ncbi:unnamed protein product [Nesidiocoris tenuis]|uniref:Uncharacterized protein n=1 Tax=Nesidiocoris tenuis TaxID=355587 RepID=A0A6H5GAS8_9HEMI|nr:unnamed protein product [Nesidiocoris tenuis]